MKKWVALLLALMMLLLGTACQETDPEKIAATVVADVNGETVSKGEAQTLYDWWENQLAFSYAQQGYSLDRTEKEFVAYMKSSVLAILSEGKALEQKLTELDGGLTDADWETIRQTAQQEYDNVVQSYMGSSEATEEEAVEYVHSIGYTPEAVEYMVYRNTLEGRLRPFAVSEITATEEEVRERYDTLVAEAEAKYTASPDAFISDYQDGSPIYFYPEGFRLVKNLIIPFPEETETLMGEKDTEYMTKLIEQMVAQSELSSEGITDERKAELEAQIETLTADMAQIDADLAAVRDAGHEAMRADAEAILAKVQEEGADFDAMMAEYGLEQTGGVFDAGYPVAEGVTYYVSEFTAAAMALENIGDISGLVGTDYGMHILQYAADMTAGPVPYDDVKTIVETELLSDKEEDVFYEAMTQWIESANIKTYESRF